tara:strand:+ start:200 stop:583 length:384 start_codon:yes stop_codon:yes gene_type:complete
MKKLIKYQKLVVPLFLVVVIYSFCTLPMIDEGGHYLDLSLFVYGFILFVCFLLNLFPILHLSKLLKTNLKIKSKSINLSLLSLIFWSYLLFEVTDDLMDVIYFMPYMVVNIVTLYFLITVFRQNNFK